MQNLHETISAARRDRAGSLAAIALAAALALGTFGSSQAQAAGGSIEAEASVVDALTLTAVQPIQAGPFVAGTVESAFVLSTAGVLVQESGDYSAAGSSSAP